MITLTPIVWTLRCGEDHCKFGDPYEGVATVQRIGDNAHVSGASKLPFKDQLELCSILRSMGFISVIFERYKNGVKKEYKRKLLKENSCEEL